MNNISVLDYGSGSGILALASMKFGATEVVGVDSDIDSINSAMKNCQLNNLSAQFYSSPLDEGLSNLAMKRFDFVVANIFTPVLIDLAPILSDYTATEGNLGLSGIHVRQAETVIQKFQNYFNNVEIKDVEQEWVLIECKNKITGDF
jgi:ribosomal protein L11 methyltransferase